MAGDDVAGIEVVRRLRLQQVPGVRFLAVASLGVELMEEFEDCDQVLIVDAVVSGCPPGTLHLVPIPWAGVRPRASARVSNHGWGAVELVELVSALGRRPPRMALLGIEIAHAMPGSCCSPQVQRAIEVVVRGFSGFQAWLDGWFQRDEREALRWEAGDDWFPSPVAQH